MIELIGWTSQILFMISAAPQAIKCWQQGHAHGLSHGMLWLWFTGEILALVYGLLAVLPLPIIINYCVNGIFMLIIMYFRYFPSTTKED